MNEQIEVLLGLVEEMREHARTRPDHLEGTAERDITRYWVSRLDITLAAMSAQPEARPCTCHPSDSPPTPCPRRYALSECREAAQAEAPASWEADELLAALGLDVTRFRTEGGRLNVVKAVAAIKYPHDYSGYCTTPPPGAVPEGQARMADELDQLAASCEVYSPDQCATLIDGIGWVAMRHKLRQAAEMLRTIAQPVSEGAVNWRNKAAEWLESKAAEQEANNLRWPDHAAVYPSWREKPAILQTLARELLATAQQPESPNAPD